jgi:hypothetical protein
MKSGSGLQSSDGEKGSRAANIPFWQRKRKHYRELFPYRRETELLSLYSKGKENSKRKRKHKRASSLEEKRNCFPFIPKEKKTGRGKYPPS